MGATKRPAEAMATSSRPSKRKAAETSTTRTSEIFDAEDVDEAQEHLEMKEKTAVDVTQEADDEDVEEVQRVVAPGFRLWKTGSGDQLMQWAKYDKVAAKYSQLLDVQSEEEFQLLPLVITQGPYQGRRVFMLEPKKTAFTFIDLPPEIRTMIYGAMFENSGATPMATSKKVNGPRLPRSLRSFNGSANILFRTSQQILKEAAPVLYGNNHFQFRNLSDMKIFLDQIGGMRKYLRHIELEKQGFNHTKISSVFRSLRDATDLRSFTVDHSNLCSESYRRYYPTTTPFALAYDLRPVLQAVQKARKVVGDESSVLDIPQVSFQKCSQCRSSSAAANEDEEICGNKKTGWFVSPFDCQVKCKDLPHHCEGLQAKIRSKLAKDLGIKE